MIRQIFFSLKCILWQQYNDVHKNAENAFKWSPYFLDERINSFKYSGMVCWKLWYDFTEYAQYMSLIALQLHSKL